MRVAMPRGDIKLVRFLINNPDGANTDVDFTEIYFTVKKTTKDRAYQFQKRLSTGGIAKLAPGDYQVKIEPEDTTYMSCGAYKFDVQLVYVDPNGVKQLQETFVGDFVLTEEVTYVENE